MIDSGRTIGFVTFTARLLPWAILYATACGVGHAIQLILAPSVSSDASPRVVPTIIEALPPLDDPRQMYVTIVFRDGATGALTSVRCITRKDNLASDVLEVQAEKALDVTSALCGSG
jgi:hypothetical protein